MVGEGEVKEPFPYRGPHPIRDTQGEQKKVMEGRKTKRESALALNQLQMDGWIENFVHQLGLEVLPV